jgi:hypothetical protein
MKVPVNSAITEKGKALMRGCRRIWEIEAKKFGTI